MKRLILSVFMIMILSTVAFAAGEVGNIVRDVQGAPYAIFKCTSSAPILKWDTTLTPPRFKCSADAGSGGFYDRIQEEGSNLTQRATLNFIGSSITCADDAGNSRTNCTLTDAFGYDRVQDEGSDLTKQPTINFIGSGVSCVNNGGSSRTDCTFTSPFSIPCDEKTEICWFDDFNSKEDDSNSGAVSIKNIGEWHADQAGTGANIFIAGGGQTVAGGGTGFQSSALKLQSAQPGSTGGRSALWRAGYGTYGPNNLIDTNARGKTVVRFAFRTGDTLSDGTNTYFFEIGGNNIFSSNVTATTDGSSSAAIFYSHGTNSGKFLGIFEDAGGNATCDTGITVATSTAYKGCIVIADDGDPVDFYLSSTFSSVDCSDPNNIVGTPVCSVNPGNDGSLIFVPFIVFTKSAGTNQRSWYVDYYGFYQKTDVSR